MTGPATSGNPIDCARQSATGIAAEGQRRVTLKISRVATLWNRSLPGGDLCDAVETEVADAVRELGNGIEEHPEFIDVRLVLPSGRARPKPDTALADDAVRAGCRLRGTRIMRTLPPATGTGWKDSFAIRG